MARPPTGPGDPHTDGGFAYRPLWVDIGVRAAGTNRYAWTAVNEGDPPTFGATLADGFAAAGTADEDGAPAYEINGRTDVAVGTRVKIWPAGDLSYYLFAFGGTDPNNPSPSASCAGAGWLAALRASDCLTASVTGAAADPSGSGSGAATTAVTLTSADGATWTSADTLAVCDGLFVPSFSPGDADTPPTMTLAFAGAASGSGSGGGGDFAVTGRLDCSGCNYAVFAFSRYDLCPCAAPLPGGPCANVVRVRVEWSECPGASLECAGITYDLPGVVYAHFGGDLAALGRIPLYAGADGFASRFRDSIRVPGAGGCDLFVTRITLGLGCYAGGNILFVVGLDTLQPGGVLANGVSLSAVVAPAALDPFDLFGDTVGYSPLEPCHVFDASSVEVTAAEPAGGAAAGYTVPGWYVLANGTVAYIDEQNKCGPFAIICGPYDTEGEAQAAAAADCGCESIAQWASAGWYCVRAPGGGSCVAAELLDADRCDTSVVICSGPYADEATATAACSGSGSGSGPATPGTLACCPAYTSSPGVGATTGSLLKVFDTCGAFTAAPGVAEFDSFPSGGAYIRSDTVYSGMWYVSILCDGLTGQWVVSLAKDGEAGYAGHLVSEQCNFEGLVRTYDFVIPPGAPGFACAGGGTVRYQITLT
jgi:hypothetical protein